MFTKAETLTAFTLFTATLEGYPAGTRYKLTGTFYDDTTGDLINLPMIETDSPVIANDCAAAFTAGFAHLDLDNSEIIADGVIVDDHAAGTRRLYNGIAAPLHVSYELSPDDLPAQAIADCSASGDAGGMVSYWIEKTGFTVDQKAARAALEGYGAWDDLDSVDDETITQRVFWLACGDFADGAEIYCLDA